MRSLSPVSPSAAILSTTNIPTLQGPLLDQPLQRNGQYLTQDGLSSTTTLTDAAGTVTQSYGYSPFGESSQSTGVANPLQFTGRENDGFGLQYNRGRYYAPEWGRFVSQDPAGFAGGLNHYAYALNNPLLFNDPDGQSPTLGLAVGGAVIGAGVGGAVAYFSGEDVGRGIAQGAIAGGIAGLTGGASLLGAVGGGALGGMAADAYGQGLDMLGGSQSCYNVGQTMGAGAAGGIGGGIGYGAGRFFSGLAQRACFPAGTPIATSSGEKPIEEIKAGDMVLSADPETGKQSYQRVERTFIRQSDELLKIVTEDGRSVEATPEHPFWVKGKGFVEAKRLARGDLLKQADGACVAVKDITSRHGKFEVYNFEVANTHTYYAGPTGLWVHNTCPPSWVRSPGAFISWVRETYEDETLNLLASEVDGLVALARGYGVDVYADAADLAGHLRTSNWNRPHIHMGKARIHIPVPGGYTIPPR